MIPEGWSKTKIEDLVVRVANPVDVQPNEQYQQIGIRSHAKGLFDKTYVTGLELGNKRVFWVEPNCFVVNIVFAWEQAVGKTTKRDAGKIASHRFPMYRPKNNKADIEFLLYLFKSKYGKHLLTLASPGGAGRNKTLGQKEFNKTIISVPPLAEQKKIAKILSTWDQAIKTTEKLIKNAEAQKKALLQQLLTGKRRLPGFHGDWRQTAIHEMGQIFSGGTPDTNVDEYWNGDFLWCTPTDITDLKSRMIDDTSRKISAAGLAASSAKLMPIGSLLVCTRATVGDLAIAAKPISTNQGFKNLVPNSAFDVDFLYFLFLAKKNEVKRYACGSTFLELSKHDFENRMFATPELAEQKRIAAILKGADDRIVVYDNQLQSLRKEKLALMQQLLTGKRRVKLDGGV